MGPRPRVLPAAGPELGDLAAELVPEHHRLVGAGEAIVADACGHLGPVVHSVAGVQIGSADPAAEHLKANLPAPGYRLGPVLDLQVRLLADDRPHWKNSLSSSLTRSGSSCCTQCEASGNRTTCSRFGTSARSGSASSVPR